MNTGGAFSRNKVAMGVEATTHLRLLPRSNAWIYAYFPIHLHELVFLFKRSYNFIYSLYNTVWVADITIRLGQVRWPIGIIVSYIYTKIYIRGKVEWQSNLLYFTHKMYTWLCPALSAVQQVCFFSFCPLKFRRHRDHRLGRQWTEQ
jgi:hypothetical protein